MQTKLVVLLTVFMFALFTLNLNAQEGEEIEFVDRIIKTEVEIPQGPTSTMEFEETTYDFGTVESGGIVSKVFTFTNTGDEILVLSNAKGSCGCTVPQWPKEPIAPGEIASITVQFDSKNKSGRQSKRVTIIANTDPAQTFLTIKGEVNSKDENMTDIVIEEPEVELSPDCFAIFPNPTAEIVKLEVEEANFGLPATISIHSKTGQLMAKRELKAIEGIIEFSVGHYPSATYVATLQIANHKPEVRCFVVVD